MNVLLNAKISNQNLITTIRNIDELKYREEIELLPSKYARNMAIALIMEAAKSMSEYFFAPWLSGDEWGGVRVVWAREFDAQVRLVIPATIDYKIYIYSEVRNEYKLDYNVSGKILAEYIRWLCKLKPELPLKQTKLGDITAVKNV